MTISFYEWGILVEMRCGLTDRSALKAIVCELSILGQIHEREQYDLFML